MSLDKIDKEDLKSFAKFYDQYEILDFTDPKILETKKKQFDKNNKALTEAIPILFKLIENVGDTTPISFVTMEVVNQNLISDTKYTEIHLNLRQLQENAESLGLSANYITALGAFTGNQVK